MRLVRYWLSRNRTRFRGLIRGKRQTVGSAVVLLTAEKREPLSRDGLAFVFRVISAQNCVVITP